MRISDWSSDVCSSDLEHVRPVVVGRHELSGRGDRLLQSDPVVLARDLAGAEALQVTGDELAVEQQEAAGPQAGDQVDQRHFRGIGLAAEHALAEDGATEPEARSEEQTSELQSLLRL